jgi:5'-3' exoribonuclease 1
MAIDGVAPRAKLNQQRSRRFRSAKDLAEASKGKEVKDRGSVHVFDSNCITPGTEFMAKVSEVIKYMIRKKLKEDPSWRHLKIIFSGHEVPGEGEHKIMSHIREMKSKPGYQPNTRHVMYGQDADLIMLGLVTHEPHFTLLREIIEFGRFGNNGKNALKTVMRFTKESDFQLLHISVLREYLQIEFCRENPELYDIERVVDDFVFLTFFAGNDFMPHLPSLDIGDGAFDLLFNTYKEQRVSWGQGQYLTYLGEISDPKRLEAYLEVIGKAESDILSKKEVDDAAFLKKKRRWNKRDGLPVGPTDEEIAALETSKQTEYNNMLGSLIAMRDEVEFVDGLAPACLVDEKDFKGRYYFEKLKLTPASVIEHTALRKAYIEGLMWCLGYYFKGCISWGWFFPFHYGPMISDLKELPELFKNITFELGEPLFPFEQLMGCLPPASAALVPKALRSLMMSPESPIIHFYPQTFEIDMNGKKNPWEGVNILPFIDVKLLKETMSSHCPLSSLTSEERRRNSFGNVYLYSFDLTSKATVPSPNLKIGLSEIQSCNSKVTVFDQTNRLDLVFKPELITGSIIPFPGFPSLNVLPILKAELTYIGLNCFGSPSKYPSTVLTLHTMPPFPPAEIFGKNIIGKSLFINWPMMHEARVVAVTDSNTEIRLLKKKIVVRAFSAKQKEVWQTESEALIHTYLTGNGSPGSGGLQIGEIQYRLKVLPLQGMRTNPNNGSTKKVFGSEEADVPLQVALWKAPAPDPRFQERGPRTISDRFPIRSCVVLTKGKYRGCKGVVVGVSEDQKVGVNVQVVPPEPPFGLAISKAIRESYVSATDAAKVLKLNRNIFGKVVGSLIIDPGKFDVGLNLKYAEGLCVVGYARKKPDELSDKNFGVSVAKKAWAAGDSLLVVGSKRAVQEEKLQDKIQWEYSPKAIRLVSEYRKTFPQLFDALSRKPNERFYNAIDFFGEAGPGLLQRIRTWLDTAETAKMPRSPVITEAMPFEAIQAVQKAADIRILALKKAGGKPHESLVKVPPSALYVEGSTTSTDVLLSSDFNGDDIPELGDRIVNLCANGIPFGVRGTVVGIHDPSSGCVEVVMDEEFVGGGNLQGACSNFRGKLCVWSHLLKVNPGDSKDLVEKLVPKKSGNISMDKIFSAVEKQGISVGKCKSEARLAQSDPTNSKLGSKSNVDPPLMDGEQDKTEDHSKSQTRTSNSASRRCGDSIGRTRQAGWKEALGPCTNGIGFSQRKGRSSGYERWRSHISHTESNDVVLSLEVNDGVGLMTRSSAESAQDATSGLKALLGIPTGPLPSTSSTDSSDLKALLGVTPTTSSTFHKQETSGKDHNNLSSAADKLLRLMNTERSRTNHFPAQMFTPSPFNFTYTEGGDNEFTAPHMIQSQHTPIQGHHFESSQAIGNNNFKSSMEFSPTSQNHVKHDPSSHGKSGRNESILPDGVQAIIPSSVFLNLKK